MSTFCNQIEEIKALIYQNKSLAYSTFSLLQEQSANDPSLLQTLADNSQNLVSLITADIAIDDEEVAAQALKCLGFIIYHPSLVSTIPVDDAYLVLEALVKVIMSTKIKSVCNLGVWCISMQQFEASILAGCFNSVLQAVVHALDNPTGSLSTTYEAMQAVMKLAAQLSERMRESSHIWAPPICRRLLSTDKRERDMSERCLLKIRPTIIPPPPSLSKALAEDIKLTLLTVMKDLLNQGLKNSNIASVGMVYPLTRISCHEI
ncbi:TELOMERE-ASSOCIATED PROTEIN RIF1 [Salix purpurea]|uniref:TELOMERE-ASSOCIATED PROTEIN RIF1 n=1 Tax=Salix purpurea TaxID=77065 RepID=A0A9Q0UL91_SALPP|nr:TELOMERE-ASSOCIATED PROTEIN RIF1 [Salix purpurea]